MSTKKPTKPVETQSAPAEKKSWARLGSMLQAKSGGYYLKFEEDVTIKAGETVLLRKPADEVQRLADRGVIDQAKADERIAKIPEFVKFNMVKPPGDSTNF